MEESKSQDKIEITARTGLHKYFHASRPDKYISGLIALVFLVIVVLKAIGMEISFIPWTDALQFAILFSILGFVLDMYYRLFEERYDKK